jgi:hypothetical protein
VLVTSEKVEIHELQGQLGILRYLDIQTETAIGKQFQKFSPPPVSDTTRAHKVIQMYNYIFAKNPSQSIIMPENVYLYPKQDHTVPIL